MTDRTARIDTIATEDADSVTNVDIMRTISEVNAMEQILIRNLPTGTKAALKARAKQHSRSTEAEAREILTEALEQAPATLVDLLSTDEGADIDFQPERLGLAVRPTGL